VKRFSVSIDIAAPPRRVWEVIRDVERWSEWTASITSIQRLDEGPLRVGSRGLVRQPKLPTNTYVVTALEEDRGFSWESRNPGVTGVGQHWIEPLPTGSLATLGVDFHGPLAGLIGWLYGRLTQRYITMEAEGLKARSEAADPHPLAGASRK
jgi:uncharacterized membrane protein